MFSLVLLALHTCYFETLFENGVITKATRCYFSTNEMHTLPELHETSGASLNTPHLYVPEKISIVTSHETHILDKLSPEWTQNLNDVKSRIMASPRTLDVDSILHVHHTSLQRERQSYWHLIIVTTVCTAKIIGILCFFPRSYLHRTFLPCYSTCKLPEPHTEFQVIPSPSSTPHQEANDAMNIDSQKTNFYDIFVTGSQLEVQTLNAGERKQASPRHHPASEQCSEAHEFCNASKFPNSAAC
jgi:hypothetical protein